jgi:hypothetical protein
MPHWEFKGPVIVSSLILFDAKGGAGDTWGNQGESGIKSKAQPTGTPRSTGVIFTRGLVEARGAVQAKKMRG